MPPNALVQACVQNSRCPEVLAACRLAKATARDGADACLLQQPDASTAQHSTTQNDMTCDIAYQQNAHHTLTEFAGTKGSSAESATGMLLQLLN
jgi:hypothetical protein